MSPSHTGSPALPVPEPAGGSTPGNVWTDRLVAAGGWTALAILVFGLGWSLMRYREQIAMLWPQSATLYALVGKPVNTTGLMVGNLRSRTDTEDGQEVLAITGRLTNITGHEVSVPRLRVTLTDSDKRVLYNWSFATNVSKLRPGQSIDFLTRLASPPGNARHADVQVAQSGS